MELVVRVLDAWFGAAPVLCRAEIRERAVGGRFAARLYKLTEVALVAGGAGDTWVLIPLDHGVDGATPDEASLAATRELTHQFGPEQVGH
jgi:hypothetical protein